MVPAVRSKLLLLGIDAGDVDLIRASLDRLPRLRALFERCPPLPLTSPADVLTSAVWPSFATGLPPGEHGVYYPMQWDPAAMQLRRVSPDWISFEPFWYDLARQGVRVTVLDVPFSLPSRLEHGIEVMNWGSQECLGPFGGNRPDIVRTIRSRFGHHPMGEDVPVEPTAARLRALHANLIAGARKKAELARFLMASTDWDLFVTVFAECHRGGHVLWPPEGGGIVPKDALLDVYRAVDDAVGHVLDGAGSDTTVVVFSTHGMGPNFTQEHFAPAIVERANLSFRGAAIPDGAPAPTRRSPMRMLREAVPSQLQYWLAKALPASARDFVVRRAFCGGLDWATTPGFLLPGSCESYVRFNLTGREAAGAFDPEGADHARYVAALREDLRTLTDGATGAPVVRDAVLARERFPGPKSHLLPDLTVLWAPLAPASELRSPRLGTMTGRLATGRTGDHRPGGFAVLQGPSRGLDRAPPLRDVTDLARLARHLLRPPGAT